MYAKCVISFIPLEIDHFKSVRDYIYYTWIVIMSRHAHQTQSHAKIRRFLLRTFFLFSQFLSYRTSIWARWFRFGAIWKKWHFSTSSCLCVYNLNYCKKQYQSPTWSMTEKRHIKFTKTAKSECYSNPQIHTILSYISVHNVYSYSHSLKIEWMECKMQHFK